jgi:lipopolysaccharide cholinephosphotransferase
MKKKMTLEEIQHYSLKVLLHVHEFCVAHHIDYTLAYGTLIGAVRHKGFIPWDDDIDIIMTRENFERFIHEFESSKDYLLVSPDDKKSYIAFARVCDITNTRVSTGAPWSKYSTGVWVDIFPMDAISDNEAEHRKRWRTLSFVWNRLSDMRNVKCRWAPKYYWKFGLKKVAYLNGICLMPVLNWFRKNIKGEKYASSSHCAQLACCDEWGYYEKKDFEEYTTLEFEGHQLMAIKEYDKVLRMLYGDYMQLPPVEDQVPMQFRYMNFYLK